MFLATGSKIEGSKTINEKFVDATHSNTNKDKRFDTQNGCWSGKPKTKNGKKMEKSLNYTN